jgi:hypothetical protein
MSSSYQKQKERIRYLEQRGKELEDIITELLRLIDTTLLRSLKTVPGDGICPDDFINDVNDGYFLDNKIMEILTERHER